MAHPPLNAEAILKQFDGLRGQGELFYNPTLPIWIEDRGLQFEFRIVQSFGAKPQLARDGEKVQTAQSDKRPPPSDGSDIDHSDPAFFVANIESSPSTLTHKLILNKFCVFRPQYLLLTIDHARRQSAPLDSDDLFAAWQVLGEFEHQQPHYVIYNCGRDGGSSRSHKHMQVLPLPQSADRDRSLLWPNENISRCLTQTPTKTVTTLPLPYLVCYQSLRTDGQPDARNLVMAYQRHLVFCAEALHINNDSGLTQVPHNVVLTRDWILTIPRTCATTDGIHNHVVNATGMIGLVWSSNDKQLDGWKSTGPVSILRKLGVPTD